MKNLKILALLLICSFVSVSCLVDDEDEILDAASQTPYTVGFKANSTLISYFEDIGTVSTQLRVSLIGGQNGLPSSQDIVISYGVDTANSTATENVEFSFGGVNQVTIPAGERSGIINLDVITGGFDPVAPSKLVLKLSSSSVGFVSALNDSYTITFVGCQSDNAGTYNSPDAPSGAGGVVSITQTEINTYTNSALPGLGFGGTGPIEWTFTNVCGELTPISWEIGTLITGSGEIDASGNLVFSDINVYNGTTIDSGVWFALGDTTYFVQ